MQVAFSVVYYNTSQDSMTSGVQQQCINETAPYLAVSLERLAISSIARYTPQLGHRSVDIYAA